MKKWLNQKMTSSRWSWIVFCMFLGAVLKDASAYQWLAFTSGAAILIFSSEIHD